MDKKQTALEHYERVVSDIFQEFVRDEITKTELIAKIHNAFYPVKAMEKQQIIDAANWDSKSVSENGYSKAEQYYNETYGE